MAASPFPINAANEEEALKAYWESAYREELAGALDADRLARLVQYRTWVSGSKGRGRRRRDAKTIEIIEYEGRCIDIHGHRSGLDVVAQEVFLDAIDPEWIDPVDELIRLAKKAARSWRKAKAPAPKAAKR